MTDDENPVSLVLDESGYVPAFKGRLAQIRKDLGLSQQELADELDLSRSAYKNYEYGVRTVPAYLLGMLLQKFWVHPVWLFTGEGPKFYLPNSDLVNQTVMQKIAASLKREVEDHPELKGRIYLFTVTQVYNRVMGNRPPTKTLPEVIDEEVRYLVGSMVNPAPETGPMLMSDLEIDQEESPKSKGKE